MGEIRHICFLKEKDVFYKLVVQLLFKNIKSERCFSQNFSNSHSLFVLQLVKNETISLKEYYFSGHTAATRTFTHSPTMPAFVTGSDDYRARFWYKKSQ